MSEKLTLVEVIMLEQAAMHYKSGQFDAALRDYQRAREYSTTADHLLACSMGLISVHDCMCG